MLLRECLGVGGLLQGDPDTLIDRVVYDSRQAGPGALFVAVPGLKTDGHEYIADAVARQVSAVAVERPIEVPPSVSVLLVPSSRRALGALAAACCRWPSRQLRVIGVTGTNGKTTTTHLIRSILMKQEQRAGLIGTVHNYVGEQERPSGLTTPEASDLQDLLSQMVRACCSHVVMEVSSEGLDMHRVDDVEFDAGVFTNLTQDHLNYHGTLERYREAKMMLFRMLGASGAKHPKVAVLNADDPSYEFFRSVCRVPVLAYGLDSRAAVCATELTITPQESRFTLRTPRGELPIALKLAGRFNVYNALAAAATCLAEGVPLETIQAALDSATGVVGRMEAIHAGQPFGVFVDYAHSPDGLENVLRAAHGFARGRLIVVFGCGGDRDRSKRPEMGRIAGEMADYTIVTSDNPRTEEPEAILLDIEAGLRQRLPPGHGYELVVNRAKAIERAIQIAQPNDVVVIAGKGHETYQILKDRMIEFDDRAIVRQLIADQLAQRGEA